MSKSARNAQPSRHTFAGMTPSLLLLCGLISQSCVRVSDARVKSTGTPSSANANPVAGPAPASMIDGAAQGTAKSLENITAQPRDDAPLSDLEALIPIILLTSEQIIRDEERTSHTERRGYLDAIAFIKPRWSSIISGSDLKTTARDFVQLLHKNSQYRLSAHNQARMESKIYHTLRGISMRHPSDSAQVYLDDVIALTNLAKALPMECFNSFEQNQKWTSIHEFLDEHQSRFETALTWGLPNSSKQLSWADIRSALNTSNLSH